MGCGGWLGLEVFVRTLMTLRGRWRVSRSREVGHRRYRGAATVSRHAFVRRDAGIQ